MQLTSLYKKTSTGAIQEWQVVVKDNTYYTISGQTTGKKTTSTPTECFGKNPGKKNETSNTDQTIKEAKSKWEAKRKKGYVDTVVQAQEGIVDRDFVAGGYNPFGSASA